MRIARAALAVLVLLVSAFAGVRWAWWSIHCDIAEGRIERGSERVEESPSDYERIRRAREFIPLCQECLAIRPDDYNMQFLLGINQQFLGHKEDAKQSYLRALQLNERPEIYTRLGLLQLDLGDSSAAWPNLLTASLFNGAYIDAIPYEELRLKLFAAVEAEHQRAATEHRR